MCMIRLSVLVVKMYVAGIQLFVFGLLSSYICVRSGCENQNM